MTLRLAIFDVDGTLIDSIAHILETADAAFESVGLPKPDHSALRAMIGISLPVIMERLVPDRPDLHADLLEAYRTNFAKFRTVQGAQAMPLFPGMANLLHTLHRQPETLLGVATGKSRRGLTPVLEAHGLAPLFVTTQVADDHPSKPSPSMVLAALSEAGVEPENAVMIGDTTFDMEMARAAGIRGVGVNWGYHDADSLLDVGADRVVSDAAALVDALAGMWVE